MPWEAVRRLFTPAETAGAIVVVGIHDLHIWAMSTSEAALTVHLIKPSVEDEDALLLRVARDLHHRFGVEQVTIQIERSFNPANCRQAPTDVV